MVWVRVWARVTLIFAVESAKVWNKLSMMTLHIFVFNVVYRMDKEMFKTKFKKYSEVMMIMVRKLVFTKINICPLIFLIFLSTMIIMHQ